MSDKRRIAVMAAGGVGGYFGARLAAAGRDVVFFARGAHGEAMRARGLRVESALGSLHVDPVRVAGEAEDIGEVDAVLFAVKLGDTETAAAALRPILKPGTPVFTFQNGVESATRIAAVLGEGHVVPGAAYIATTIAEPGVIRHTGTLARLVFGEIGGETTARVCAFRDDCIAAGIDVELAADPLLEIWNKFVRLAPLSGVTALTRSSIGPVRDNPDTFALLRAAIAEAVAVARAQGIALAGDIEERVLAWFGSLPGEMTSSMAHDLAAGRSLELPWLSGAVARLAEAHGVPAPTHRFIAQALALQQAGNGRRRT